jgi:CheY-like chemotaxis protein/GAF domain-containing protein
MLMSPQLYGLIIAAVAGILFPIVARLRRQLLVVSVPGWGTLYFGLTCFVIAGLLTSLVNAPSLTHLLSPLAATLFAAASYLAIGAGLTLIILGISSIVSSVRHIEDQKSDDEDWRNLYLHLQDLSQQPFSFVEILNLGLNQLLKRTEADGAAVMLFKENSSELVLAAFSNLAPETTKKLELLKVTGDIFGRAQKLGRIQSVANLAEAERGTMELLGGSGFMSAAVFPLRSRERVLGSVGLFSAKPFHFTQKRCDAIAVATNQLASLLETVRNDKEIIRLKERLKPSEEAKRIVEELFFRRGIGANLALREAVEFERVRRFFDADSIKLVFCDGDGEYRIKASSGGAETGLKLDKRKLTGISRAVSEKKLLLLTSPLSSPAGNGYDSMPRQTLFIPVPYPDRHDLVLLLENNAEALEFSEAKLSAVRVASVYLADLHFLFLAKRDGERFRTSAAQLDDSIGRILNATSRSQMVAALGEACATVLPAAKGRLVILAAAEQDDDLLVADVAGLTVADEMDWIRYNRFLKAMQDILMSTGEGEKRIEKLVLANIAPPDLRERFDKYFANLPLTMVQSVMPIEFGGRHFGVVGLFFSDEEAPPREAAALYRRLVHIASLNLYSTSHPVSTDKEPVENPGPANATVAISFADSDLEHHADRHGWEAIDTDLELATMPPIERSELTALVESLVMRLFLNYPREKLYLSSLSERRFRYYQISINPDEIERFHKQQFNGDEWHACALAADFPMEFRSLVGDYQVQITNGKAATVTWRVPLVVSERAKSRRINVLGIDDQEVIRELLHNIISHMGHRIVTAGNGQDALKLFNEEKFDVVILESGLPGIDGWDVAAQVKALSPATPVIMLSGWGPLDDRQTILRRNADFILTKPFKMDQLSEVITAACQMIAG